MGKQVNFYMLADDLAEFEEFIRSKENVLLVKDRFSAPEIQTLDTLTIPEMGKTPLSLLLVREKDLEKVVIKSVVGKYWTIDELRSPAVELMRSYHDERIARRGRLYFQPGFYDKNDNWVDKPPEFIKWADSLLRWIRRNYHSDPRVPRAGLYIGPSAWQWFSEGKGILELN
jgi:hypothetical protein